MSMSINRVVLTNKMPASLIRGFGGPQLYLALERLVQRIAVELGLDHLDVIRRNLVPTGEVSLPAAAGALYDSGDYPRAVETAIGDGRLDDLKKRRDEARKAGRKYGIGFAVVVEPAMSNMGYLSTLLTPETRDKAGPKNGATSMVTVNVDPLGAVSVTADVTVQGQGHETVLSQIVADQLGLAARRRRRDAGDGHREGPVVDRRRHLFLPLHAGHRGRRAHGGERNWPTSSRASRAKQLNVMADDVELCRRQDPQQAAIPTTRCRSAASPAPRTGRR